MLDQIYAMSRILGKKVSRVVVMGSGEPMDNYDNLLRFIQLLTDENGLNMGQRNLTVSTCGIVPRIRQLAEQHLQINLALSLHASNDAKRKQLMPIANEYSLTEVMDACRYYFDQTGRQLTFEYALVGGVNDTEEDAAELIRLLKDLNCIVNLIPVNPIKERNYTETGHSQVVAFKNKLEKSRINVTIRREMGRDIDGACGQLRRRHLNEQVGN
jgi:23S rRNA (adenine2503-C2)-methyltransferase